MTDLDIRTTDRNGVRPALHSVAVAIGDPLLRMAVTSILKEAGYPLSKVDNGKVFLVTDDPSRSSLRAILFVNESPGSARLAVDALLAGRLGGFVAKREPDGLLNALQSLESGMISGSASVMRRACDAPKLQRRQTRILRLVAAGKSNGQIALQLHLSEATIKREVSVLLRVFEAESRVELAMKTSAVGYSE